MDTQSTGRVRSAMGKVNRNKKAKLRFKRSKLTKREQLARDEQLSKQLQQAQEEQLAEEQRLAKELLRGKEQQPVLKEQEQAMDNLLNDKVNQKRKRSDRPRGRRSKEAKNRRYLRRSSLRYNAKYLAESRTLYHQCSSVPGDFITRKSKKQVRETIRLKYGKARHAYRSGNVEVICPLKASRVLFKKSHLSLVTRVSLSTLRMAFPNFLVKQFGNVVSDGQMDMLIAKWQAIVDTGVKPKGKQHETRSKNPAFHFGVWRRYKKIVHVTQDTESEDDTVRQAIDEFLNLLRNYVASKIATYTEYYAPRIWKEQKKNFVISCNL